MNQSITPIQLVDTKGLQRSGQHHVSNAPMVSSFLTPLETHRSMSNTFFGMGEADTIGIVSQIIICYSRGYPYTAWVESDDLRNPPTDIPTKFSMMPPTFYGYPLKAGHSMMSVT